MDTFVPDAPYLEKTNTWKIRMYTSSQLSSAVVEGWWCSFILDCQKISYFGNETVILTPKSWLKLDHYVGQWSIAHQQIYNKTWREGRWCKSPVEMPWTCMCLQTSMKKYGQTCSGRKKVKRQTRWQQPNAQLFQNSILWHNMATSASYSL